MKQTCKLIIQILCIVSIFLCLIIPFTGCQFDEKLTPEKELIESVETVIKGAECQDVDADEGQYGKEKEYEFEIDEIKFKVRNYLMPIGSIFRHLENRYETDYFDKLLQIKSKNIDEIAKQHNIQLIILNENENIMDFEIAADSTKVLCVVGMDYEYCDYITISFYIDTYNQIDNIYKFMQDVKNELDDYLPNTFIPTISLQLDATIRSKNPIRFNDTESTNFYSANLYLTQDMTNDLRLFTQWTKYNYKSYVASGDITDNSINMENHKPFIIEHLYIDEELFDSQNKMEFIYNLEDDTYYVPILFATQNGGLHQDIIERYYKNSNYEIKANNVEYGYKVQYTIEKESFVMKEEAMYNVKCYKNHKDMAIQCLRQINGYNATAPLIAIDDFVELIGMEIDRIDIEEGSIYLTT